MCNKSKCLAYYFPLLRVKILKTYVIKKKKLRELVSVAEKYKLLNTEIDSFFFIF